MFKVFFFRLAVRFSFYRVFDPEFKFQFFFGGKTLIALPLQVLHPVLEGLSIRKVVLLDLVRSFD